MTFEFVYRSPMKWLEGIISDPTLAPLISWYPYKKILCINGEEIPMYDEPCTGERWWDTQVFGNLNTCL